MVFILKKGPITPEESERLMSFRQFHTDDVALEVRKA